MLIIFLTHGQTTSELWYAAENKQYSEQSRPERERDRISWKKLNKNGMAIYKNKIILL